MIEINNVITIFSLLAASISIIGVIITLYDRKKFTEGLKNTYNAKELELRQKDNKHQLAQQKFELEKKKHDAMEKWKKFGFGLKLLDLIFPKEEIIEEYEEERKAKLMRKYLYYNE